MVFGRFFAPKAPQASVPQASVPDTVDKASFPVKNPSARLGKPGSKFPVYTEGEIVEGNSGEIQGVTNPKFTGIEVSSLNQAKVNTGSENAFFAFMGYNNNPQHEIKFLPSDQQANLIYVEAAEPETPSQATTMGGRKRRSRRKKRAKKSRKNRRRTYKNTR